jgi:membrane protease YdiL (CAAX protease family)
MALSFAAAYAATGSLLVPIVMHALFNGSTLAVLLVLKTCSALQYIQ